ncbi:MAG TPA: hypothetical protein VK742_09025 [Candidatus Sulfotelmatobacter sp.]|nr:hypothetical protein [Candidatus Sulfotelmatobacter sp.]
MKHLTGPQKEIYEQNKKLSILELYARKAANEDLINSNPEKQIILALIERHKDRRDWWTLIAALVAAVGTVTSVVMDFLYDKH